MCFLQLLLLKNFKRTGNLEKWCNGHPLFIKYILYPNSKIILWNYNKFYTINLR